MAKPKLPFVMIVPCAWLALSAGCVAWPSSGLSSSGIVAGLCTVADTIQSNKAASSLPTNAESGLVLAVEDVTQPQDVSVGGSVDPLVAVSYDQTELLPGMTLQEFESLALANNPSLQELAATTQKAAGFREQVGLYANPTMGYQAQQLADRGTDQHTVFAEQEFVTGNKFDLNRRVLNQNLRAQLQELEAQRLRVISDIRSTFYQALAVQRQMELISEFQSVSNKGLELAELRKQAAEGSQIDVLQAKIQKNEIDLALQQAQLQFEGYWRELSAIAGISDLRPTRLIGDLRLSVQPLDWVALRDQLTNSSPEFAAAQARIVAAQALLNRHGVQAIPNVTVQFAAGVDNGTESGMMNLQVGAPVPVFNKNQGNIAAARAELVRANWEAQRVAASISARLAALSRQYDSALAATSKYEAEILPSAQAALALAEEAYQAGVTDFLQVLIARRMFFDSNLQYIEAQMQLATAQARVDGLTLSGSLEPVLDGSGDSSLRDLTFGQQ